MIRKLLSITHGAFFLMILFAAELAANTHDFFAGKTGRIIVGLSAGGGFDVYARVIARHLGKHIPGNPNFIVENMTGAGSLISANHMYNIAKPDGLTVGHFVGGLFSQQLLGREGVMFDARKFEYVGAAVVDQPACTIMKATGITSIEQWLASKTPVKFGATGSGLLVDMPKILKAALGVPIQLVVGFKGTADLRLAAERGEIDGSCWNWAAIKATWQRSLDSGDVNVVIQANPETPPELKKVPQAINFAKTAEARQLIQVGIHDTSAIARPFVLPPKTPKDRVRMYRKAFLATLKDPQFIADAEKAKLDIEPMTGDDMEETIARMFKLDPVTVNKLREVLK